MQMLVCMGEEENESEVAEKKEEEEDFWGWGGIFPLGDRIEPIYT